MKQTFDDHLKRGHPITLGVLAFFSMLELIQTAVLVSSYNRNDDFPSLAIRDRTRFLLFVSIWTTLFCLFYIYGFMKAAGSFLFSIASHGFFLFFTWLFWLAGSAALTNAIGGKLDCSSLVDFPHCNALNSVEAFGWINFIISTFAFIIILFVGATSARGGNGFGGALIV